MYIQCIFEWGARAQNPWHICMPFFEFLFNAAVWWKLNKKYQQLKLSEMLISYFFINFVSFNIKCLQIILHSKTFSTQKCKKVYVTWDAINNILKKKMCASFIGILVPRYVIQYLYILISYHCMFFQYLVWYMFIAFKKKKLCKNVFIKSMLCRYIINESINWKQLMICFRL